MLLTLMNTSILFRHAFLVFYAMFLHLGPNVLAAETWAATGSMSTSRANHTATLLTNGKVLVVGGGGYGGSGTSYNILAKAELFNPSISSWTQTGELSTARFGHTATLLSSGKVLVVGGFINDSPTSTASAELYDPTTAAWTSAGSLTSARGLHTATLLPNGKVLVVGGYVGTDLASAEIYDPATGTWTPTGSLGTARYYHSATLLSNGKVLVAGGGGTMLSSAELYDSTSGTWAPASSMSVPHRDHTATLLPNGKVLVTGGGGTLPISRICELYDPLANSWTQTGDLINGRSGSFTAILLSTGKVLVVGGWDGYNTISASELYDPILGIWTATGSNIALRHGHAATLMLNGKILAQGGSDNTAGNTIDSAEIYDPGTLVIALAQSPHGNITGNANHYLPGSMALLTAAASPGYIFGSWSGDASGSTNPTTVLMDADKTVGVNFVEDSRDYDNDGLTNFQEIITYSTDSTLADTDSDGINDGAEVTQGRSPKTAEPVITNITATQRSGTKIVDISYDLASVTPTVKVTLEISSDGGLTYNVPVASTTGAIGNAVTVGSGKTIDWNAGVDWDGNFSNQMRFRLIADDLQVPGFSMIPAGAFTMGRTSGDTDTNALPVNVTVSQFYMGKYEVTKAEWDEVRAWAVNNGYTDLATGAGKATNHPVQTVSWWDVIKWCNARSQKEGLTPCYTVSGLVMKTGTTAPTVNWTANGYRLPTEAEWEKAARGGVSGKRFPWGTDTISHSEANFNNSGSETYKSGSTGYHPIYGSGSTPYTSPVGSFLANGYGLHDMAGNVWEWCWDWYAVSAYVNNATDPRGAASGTFRLFRGASWAENAIYCRASFRDSGTPLDARDNRFGFRVVRSNSLTLGVSNSSSAQNSTVDIRNFSLSKTTTTNGSISGTASHLSGSSATVTATPQPGYLFGSWTGDASGSSNPTTVLMDANKTVGATFVEDSRDPDSDGLTNYQEIIVRLTNPDLADTDSDGVNDGQEVTDATNPLIADSDGDGLTDGDEKTRSTNPLLSDTDGDGYSDSYEVQFFTDPKLAISVPKFSLTLSNNGSALGGSFASAGSLAHGTNASVTATPLPGYLFGSWTGDASGSANPTTVLMDANKTVGATFVEDSRDPDSDGLNNYQEIIVRLTNPDLADSDSDGVNDGQEVTDATNPLLADTDTDGLTDGEEKTRGTNPLVADSDSDGVNDSQEVTDATNPLVADSDGDGLTDGEEKSRNTNPLTQDTDGDGVSDAQEVTDATNPLLADTDGDGLNDGQEKTRATNPLVTDSDSDGVNDGQEVSDGTNPLIADTDGDGLTDSEEKTMATNPLVADSDGDGLTDGEEKTRSTNPLAKDTDGDGLSDLEEELNTKTNPLLADTDGDSISDALEDTDNDGISNLREVTELKTDPLLVDTDADGLSDTYELVYKGTVAAFVPRIGDRLRFELRELVPQGTLKLVGALPTGLSFNAVTGVLEGKLTGKAGLVKLSIQVLNGKTVIRTIPLQFTVSAFPSGLIGTWQVLLEDANGSPQGMITTTISSPGAWTATYDSLGTKTMRSSKGVFDLTPSMDRAAFAITFPVVSLTPAFSSSWQIDATTALASGTYAQGTLRGFRLAKTGELPTASRQITMVIDQGEQDGYQIPAGLGWATGTLGTTGSLPLSGQLGDAQSLKTTVRLSATGQAMLWVKPYRNLNSFVGGIISLRDTGVIPQTPFTAIQNGLQWQRMADSAELSYSSGFGPIAADSAVNPHIKPTTALALATNLALTNNQFRNVVFDGGGLPSAEQFTTMPQRFVMDSSYKLNSVALPGRVMALWQGGISASAGTFTGTIALDASNSGILKGNASVSGVVFRRNELETVGAGLIKIPTTGVKGSFRTGTFLMDR